MKRKLFSFIIFFIVFSYFSTAENYNDYIIDLDSKNYYLSAYYDTLKKEDRNILKEYFPDNDMFDDTVWDEADGTIVHKWYEENFFPFEKIELIMTLSNTISNNRLLLGHDIFIDIKTLFKQEQKTIIQFSEQLYGQENIWYIKTFLDWKILRQTDSNTLVFVEDGDYLNIYYDKDKLIPFATFARMNDETLEQFKKLIYNNTCDLSKVTWPRHADGSCDYDGSSKAKKNGVVDKKSAVVSTGSTTTTNSSASTAETTNVSVKKIMTTNCNLKLRAAEATSSNVLTVMALGTKVKILELGKAETIDGISSNWVKVEVQGGAKDRDGKAIAKGLVGWAYGGYLE